MEIVTNVGKQKNVEHVLLNGEAYERDRFQLSQALR